MTQRSALLGSVGLFFNHYTHYINVSPLPTEGFWYQLCQTASSPITIYAAWGTRSPQHVPLVDSLLTQYFIDPLHAVMLRIVRKLPLEAVFTMISLLLATAASWLRNACSLVLLSLEDRVPTCRSSTLTCTLVTPSPPLMGLFLEMVRICAPPTPPGQGWRGHCTNP